MWSVPSYVWLIYMCIYTVIYIYIRMYLWDISHFLGCTQVHESFSNDQFLTMSPRFAVISVWQQLSGKGTGKPRSTGPGFRDTHDPHSPLRRERGSLGMHSPDDPSSISVDTIWCQLIWLTIHRDAHSSGAPYFRNPLHLKNTNDSS